MKIKAEEIFEKGTKVKNDKANTLVNMLEQYILRKARENDLLPTKEEVSSLLNVSMGTVQNAYRILEDRGLVKSKQKVGTIITSSDVKKQSSKRDCCINLIKKYMENNNINTTLDLPPIRKIAKELNMSPNTVNSAIKSIANGNLAGSSDGLALFKKVAQEIEKYIIENCKVGDNIPSLIQFAKEMNVSVKTVHDATRILKKKNILKSHRGIYGTVVVHMPGEQLQRRKEDYIFAPAKDAVVYHYQKIQNMIKHYIIKNCEVGSKLPSVKDMANDLGVNVNTIRHALEQLTLDGYVKGFRGRYGGTFVTDLPDEKSYKWLAVNPQYVASLEN